MKILLNRFTYGDHFTIGHLYIDNALTCQTLEDIVREVPLKPVNEWKVPKETAIPSGTYKVVITYSNRFKKPLPLLLNVPGFEGVRIHSGNKSDDTEGCILVGIGWTSGDWITKSREALLVVQTKIQKALDNGEEVTIQIVNT